MQRYGLGIRMHFHPCPAVFSYGGRNGFQFLGHQPVKQEAVREVSLVLGVEEITNDDSASRLVGFCADEPGATVGAINLRLGQEVPDGLCR